jgi:hypothetical protein
VNRIPLAARILRVADAYAALTDARPFRPALTEEDARRHLTEWAGLEFDPQVVRVFLSLQNFAELRSYARRDDLNTPASPSVTQNETDNALTPEQRAPVGSSLPEMKTNLSAQNLPAHADSATASGNFQDSFSFPKTDTDTHA